MRIERTTPWPGFLEERDSEGSWQTRRSTGYVGHSHFWQRAFSRRNFVRAAAGVTGLGLASGRVMRALAQGAGGTGPNPVPGGTHLPFLPDGDIVHFFFPGPGHEPSTITDFNGFVGLANVNGTGTGTETSTGNTTPLLFGSDNRFMKGTYVGADGQTHLGTFAFI